MTNEPQQEISPIGSDNQLPQPRGLKIISFLWYSFLWFVSASMAGLSILYYFNIDAGLAGRSDLLSSIAFSLLSILVAIRATNVTLSEKASDFIYMLSFFCLGILFVSSYF